MRTLKHEVTTIFENYQSYLIQQNNNLEKIIEELVAQVILTYRRMHIILTNKHSPLILPFAEVGRNLEDLMPSNIGYSYGDIYDLQKEKATNTHLNNENVKRIPLPLQWKMTVNII